MPLSESTVVSVHAGVLVSLAVAAATGLVTATVAWVRLTLRVRELQRRQGRQVRVLLRCADAINREEARRAWAIGQEPSQPIDLGELFRDADSQG